MCEKALSRLIIALKERTGMADIKLFQLNGQVKELKSQSVALEKSLQTLIERNLETFLGVRFLASEHVTGKQHGGRIDTLGIDENRCPVIIEYKRAVNENVINQGLFYLDWLMDHKAEFELLVLKKYGQQVSENIEWSSPRLLCIAGDFTRYDEHAVQQINRNIELIRYRKYGDDFLLFELVNATSSENHIEPVPDGEPRERVYKTVTEYLEQSPPEVKSLFENIKTELLALSDDVQMKVVKFYFAFKRLKNFACVEIRPQVATILIYLNINPAEIELVDGFIRDVSEIGHFGTGNVEVRIKSQDDFERIRPLILKSYEQS